MKGHLIIGHTSCSHTKYYREIFTRLVPRADEINAMVRQVKLWFPPSHFVTSLGRCPVIFANWLLVIPFCFITESILAAIPSVSAKVALSSGVIFANSSFSMSSYISIIGQNMLVLFLLLPSVQSCSPPFLTTSPSEILYFTLYKQCTISYRSAYSLQQFTFVCPPKKRPSSALPYSYEQKAQESLEKK